MDTTHVPEFLRESNAIEGVYDHDSLITAHRAWDSLINRRETMHSRNILIAHKILMRDQGLEPHEIGAYRTCPVYIGTTQMLPHPLVPAKVSDWCRVLNDRKHRPDWKLSHIEFETIHPFVDGNGRIGRMLMNWHRVVICKLPILVIKESARHTYYQWFKRN